MAPLKLATLLVAVAAAQDATSSTTRSTSLNWGDEDVFTFSVRKGVTSDPVTVGTTSVKVYGQGGRLATYARNETDPNKVVVRVDALRELSAMGALVGTANATVRHSFDSFASLDFDVGMPREDVNIGTAKAKRISFAAPVVALGQLQVNAFVLTKSGLVGPDFARWVAAAGDVNWNLNLSSWAWCGCSQGGWQERGAYVDIDLSIAGSWSVPQQTGDFTWSLGGGVVLELPNTVEVDGVDIQMPGDYPRLVSKSTGYVFVVRFPRFQKAAIYNSLIRMTPAANKTSATLNPMYVSRGAGLANARGAAALKVLALAAGAMWSAGLS